MGCQDEAEPAGVAWRQVVGDDSQDLADFVDIRAAVSLAAGVGAVPSRCVRGRAGSHASTAGPVLPAVAIGGCAQSRPRPPGRAVTARGVGRPCPCRLRSLPAGHACHPGLLRVAYEACPSRVVLIAPSSHGPSTAGSWRSRLCSAILRPLSPVVAVESAFQVAGPPLAPMASCCLSSGGLSAQPNAIGFAAP